VAPNCIIAKKSGAKYGKKTFMNVGDLKAVGFDAKSLNASTSTSGTRSGCR